ncbi:MAG TPA: maltose alpha-D-glucosyltransferase, partial [Longimicrobiales bacterium]|nr:maltose alpha-D-glucosyltransferase [Longimicrobiales bacterium]
MSAEPEFAVEGAVEGGTDAGTEWYKDAIIYQVHVRAYKDSNADGIGDFAGLTEQLDYLQDLGVTAIWLLPFYPSPLRDDGYDIADYTDVNAIYGSLEEFKTFLDEAHRRGLRVITELVLNHTSDQHQWFRAARRAAPGDPARAFYVWSETNQKYQDVRIIFKDFERSNWTWDAEANAYYWHRFYAHQPDLNFDNPAVHRALERIFDFWIELGVDGFRLDAIPYLYEREGTSSENLPETHEYIKQLRAYVDAKSGGSIMLLAEANMWPDEAVQYFGDGDECHMAFHFPVMPRLYMAVQMEDRYPIIDILQQTPAIPPICQWATFLRNHDELTLEMVTDEDRDYMYRVYAHDPQARINLGIRRRLAPLMGNNRRRIELMNALLFSLPGTPIIYYGDEIGMGDNIYLGDRNGVRTPMQWSGDRNAGFSRANPQRLYFPVIIDPEYHYEAVNVEAQQNNPQSLLWWMKRIIALRKQHRAFGRGTIEFLHPDNPRVLAFVREYEEERILVVVNLSRFAQIAQLDLSAYAGLVPVEMFGRTPFPAVTDQPYSVTLAPHVFYWFSLERAGGRRHAETAGAPTIRLRGRWLDALRGRDRERLEEVLGDHVLAARWFRSKAREVARVDLVDAVRIPCGGDEALFCFVDVRFIDGEDETYVVPLAFATGERARTVAEQPRALVAHVATGSGEPAVLYDALWDEAAAGELVDAVAHGGRCRGEAGDVIATRTRALADLPALATVDGRPTVTVLRGEQSNTSLLIGERILMKVIRKVEPGINPELEIGRFLAQQPGYQGAPKLLGALEYRRGREDPATLATLHEFVPSEGDAWSYTVDELGRYFERVLARQAGTLPEIPEAPATDRVAREVPPEVQELLGGYLGRVRRLGQRTAEMHRALANAVDAPAFTPEPIVAHYRRGRVESFRNLVRSSFL